MPVLVALPAEREPDGIERALLLANAADLGTDMPLEDGRQDLRAQRIAAVRPSGEGADE
jgi:hypothetical protein